MNEFTQFGLMRVDKSLDFIVIMVLWLSLHGFQSSQFLRHRRIVSMESLADLQHCLHDLKIISIAVIIGRVLLFSIVARTGTSKYFSCFFD